MESNRVEQLIIRRNNTDYYTYSKMAHIANNIYNLATYYARQWFFKGIYVSVSKLDKQFKHLIKERQNVLYKQLNIHVCQQIFRKVNSNFKAFFKALKMYHKHPEIFTGRPKPPSYHHKGGMSTFWIDNQNFKFNRKHQKITFHKNKSCKSWWKLQLSPIHMNPHYNIIHVGQIVVVPKRFYVEFLISYKVMVSDVVSDNHRYMGIDPGVNNLLCCGFNVADCHPFIINGRALKSINQYANKEIAYTQHCLIKCNHKCISHYLDFLFTKRHFKLYYLCHEASKDVVDYALNHNISRIIIGNGVLSSKQKSNMGHKNNQNFISIPFGQLIQNIQYKAQDVGIKVIITEESYTSQSSFIDNEYPCKSNGNLARKARGIKHWKRRIKRGLYKSTKGLLINADLNGALQIIKKVVPKAFNYADGIEGLVKAPIKINL